MKKFVFTNPYLPVTLQIPLYIGYMNLIFLPISIIFFNSMPSPIYLLIIILGVLASIGLANQRTWSYVLAILIAIAPFVIALFAFLTHQISFREIFVIYFVKDIISTLMRILIICTLLHPASKKYVSTYFENRFP